MTGKTTDVMAEVFADDGTFPNSRLPVLIYREALAGEAADAEAMEALFAAGGWSPQWRAGVYDYHHYHSTAHEVLGVASGEAEIMLGGPDGRVFAVAAGDVIVIPAGVAHRRISASSDFLVVGGYPPGQDWNLLRGAPGDRPKADAEIAAVPLPATDPVSGAKGPLLQKWHAGG
ncbi:cupin domain-containing protein [Arsenicitalea aurantiaca]|uniref:Cupin domain-containing protein n=1 Tax=Arsenicitalea aurantiaca TaxID=1783274 RepID=A0A433XLT5_9HYPH|nr:cupin domain-containing protein [Arsenicitalea aurantiaca]RUT35013.1 cupin domain-containing protein [Arsenicitalea aurantiaca]